MLEALALVVLTSLFAHLASGLIAESIEPAARHRIPVATLAVTALVLAGLIAQLAQPRLLGPVERHGTAWLHGEPWRLITPLFFQDGGLWEACSTCSFWRCWAAWSSSFGVRAPLAIYFAGGTLCEWIASAWQLRGAGNSIATFALAGSLLALALRRCARAPTRHAAVAAALAGVALAAVRDIHGVAVLVGAVLGLCAVGARRLSENR